MEFMQLEDSQHMVFSSIIDITIKNNLNNIIQ